MAAQFKLKKLWSRKTSEKVCMMYKIMNRLVDVNPAAPLLKSRNGSSRGHKYQLQVPHSGADMYLHSYFPLAIQPWNSVLTLWDAVPTDTSSVVTVCL